MDKLVKNDKGEVIVTDDDLYCSYLFARCRTIVNPSDSDWLDFDLKYSTDKDTELYIAATLGVYAGNLAAKSNPEVSVHPKSWVLAEIVRLNK